VHAISTVVLLSVQVAVATPAVATGVDSNAPEPLPKIVTMWLDATPDIPADIQTTANMLNQILLIHISSCRLIGIAKTKNQQKAVRPSRDIVEAQRIGHSTMRATSKTSIGQRDRGITASESAFARRPSRGCEGRCR
jgi:hypothetical protein